MEAGAPEHRVAKTALHPLRWRVSVLSLQSHRVKRLPLPTRLLTWVHSSSSSRVPEQTAQQAGCAASAHKHSTTLSGPASSSGSGIVGSSADRVSPQNFCGDMSFLVAVNFHPMWLAQILHWATVQANLRVQGQNQLRKRVCA